MPLVKRALLGPALKRKEPSSPEDTQRNLQTHRCSKQPVWKGYTLSGSNRRTSWKRHDGDRESRGLPGLGEKGGVWGTGE